MELTGKARGTFIEILSYAKASEGYPTVAESTEASRFEHENNWLPFKRSSAARVSGLLRR